MDLFQVAEQMRNNNIQIIEVFDDGFRVWKNVFSTSVDKTEPTEKEVLFYYGQMVPGQKVHLFEDTHDQYETSACGTATIWTLPNLESDARKLQPIRGWEDLQDQVTCLSCKSTDMFYRARESFWRD